VIVFECLNAALMQETSLTSESSRSRIRNSDCSEKTPEHFEEQEVNPGKEDDYGAWIDGWAIGDRMP